MAKLTALNGTLCQTFENHLKRLIKLSGGVTVPGMWGTTGKSLLDKSRITTSLVQLIGKLELTSSKFSYRKHPNFKGRIKEFLPFLPRFERMNQESTTRDKFTLFLKWYKREIRVLNLKSETNSRKTSKKAANHPAKRKRGPNPVHRSKRARA